MRSKNLSILFLLFFVIISVPQANAFWGFAFKTVKAISAISKNAKVLSKDEIIRLSKLLNEVKGTKKVGKELAKLNLPEDVLEDTFLRIAIYQKKLTRKEAEEMFSRLSGTPGFHKTLRKIIGQSEKVTKGHLNELRIADAASKNGFKVVGIGERFVDGIKKSPTDIDIVLKKGGKKFAIEAKDYDQKIPMDKFRADLDTLVAYKRSNNSVIPVFTITKKPDDIRYLERLKYEAKKRGVQLIFGNPGEQIEQIKMLEKIL